MSETPSIITSIPRYSDGEVDREFMKELENGFEIETEDKRDNAKCKPVKKLMSYAVKTHPVLGKPVGNKCQLASFFRFNKKSIGHEQVHSKEFLQYYNKKLPRT